MPPKNSSPPSRSAPSAAAPYPRRSSGQPKSSRQQFSACGACRMRRVRCDLKDLSASSLEANPTCSNCQERGLKCVDEFAEVKAVKLLRRGRRLQQVEAVYGKVADNQSPSSSFSVSSSVTPRQESIIPPLRPEFFSSTFFRRFSLQCPILDPTEFTSRFFAFSKGDRSSLTPEGQICAMLLVVWAASYGVDENGIEQSDGPRNRKDRRQRTHAMVKELLGLIDNHGILRKPTWDGVRALILILPLTEDVQLPLDRIAMHEATLSQIYTLCSHASPSSVQSGQGPYGDALVRARIFWCAHIHEGVTTGLRGGRLILSNDDLSSFQSTLPRLSNSSSPNPASSGSRSTPGSPGIPFQHVPSTLSPPLHHSPASLPFAFASHLFSLPLYLASVCRQIHTVLTGPKARHHDISEDAMLDVWAGLSRSWEEFQSICSTGAGCIGVVGIGASALTAEDVERFASGWQIFIFECHNVIRETLRQHLISRHHSSSSSQANNHLARLHTVASRKCHDLLPHVLDIVRRHLNNPASRFFAYDASLVRDGCFFAGYLVAQGERGDSDVDDRNQKVSINVDAEEGVQLCLRALSEMRWAYSKGEEREKTVRAAWEERCTMETERRRGPLPLSHRSDPQSSLGFKYSGPGAFDHNSPPYTTTLMSSSKNFGGHGHSLSGLLLPHERPFLPPLSLALSPGRTLLDSGPNTACTSEGSWPTYTPPTTASESPQLSSPSQSGGSPEPLSYLPTSFQFKSEGEGFYDVEQFAFSAPMPLPSISGDDHPTLTGGLPSFQPREHEQLMGPGIHTDFLDSTVVFSAPGSGINGSDDGCPHFGGDCHGFYQGH